MSIKKQSQTEIVEQFQGGADVAQLAEDHSLSLMQVCRILHQAGETLPELDLPDSKRKGRHEARNAEIVALRQAGFSYNALAEEFQLSAGRIGDLCREALKADEEQEAEPVEETPAA